MTGTPLDDRSRYRCAGCGNLTRFDVEARRHSRRFLHFSLAGEPTVEEEEVISEQVEAVICRWCGRSDAIEVVPRVSVDE